ncbi:MAG: DUF4339 domain-containing protein [Bdellovibrionales bacterium]|nr:DUF4339 domain-containing protein [Bdellovibrionales bacterium]
MSAKWFICQNENVTGPFSTEQVQNRLQSADVAAGDLIWGRGLSAWQTLRSWQNDLPNLNADTYVEPAPEAWHYALAGKSFGPYNRATLIGELKNVHQIGEVMVWTKGMKEWAHLFEFHEILTEIGVNKRSFPRTDLNGKVIIKADGQTLIAPTLTVSEGGMGVQLEVGLVPGQGVSLEIQSAVFRETLHAKADVRYVAGGVVGLKFTQLSPEARGAIVQLVRQATTRFVLKAA